LGCFKARLSDFCIMFFTICLIMVLMGMAR
jgi:hypothetical protein